jgi:hypothetical protein
MHMCAYKCEHARASEDTHAKLKYVVNRFSFPVSLPEVQPWPWSQGGHCKVVEPQCSQHLICWAMETVGTGKLMHSGKKKKKKKQIFFTSRTFWETCMLWSKGISLFPCYSTHTPHHTHTHRCLVMGWPARVGRKEGGWYKLYPILSVSSWLPCTCAASWESELSIMETVKNRTDNHFSRESMKDI